MRLEQSSLSVAAANIALDIDKFDSGLLDEGELLNLARFPTSKFAKGQMGEAADPAVSRTLQGNAVALAQGANAIATNIGISGFSSLGDNSFDAILRLVGQDSFLHDTKVKALVEGGVQSVIDGLVAGPLASVPFVGAAATVLWSIGVAIFDAHGEETRLPPMLRLDPAADNRATRDAIALLKDESFNDWTPIFLPTTQGLWGTTREVVNSPPARGSVEDGIYTYLSARQPQAEYRPDVYRLGCAPGDLFYVDAGFQSRITRQDVTIPSNANSPQLRNVLQTGDNPSAMHRLAFPLSDWYPSLSALGRSVWSLVGSSESTAMFQVDATKVAEEWAQFATASAYFRADMDAELGRRIDNISKAYKRHSIAFWLGNYAAAMHTLRARDDDGKLHTLSQEQLLAAVLDPAKRAGEDCVGRQAVRHANKLGRRQRQAAETPLNALVSKDAPALRGSSDLREHFHKHRTLQLDAGKFDGIALDDIPDQGLRDRLLARLRPAGGMGGPNSFADPVSVERDRRLAAEFKDARSSIEKPEEFGGYGAERDPDDTTGGGYGLAIAGLAVTAGLVGGGVALARRRRANRR